MIKVTAEVTKEKGKEEVATTCDIVGMGGDILDEAYAIIEALMDHVKEVDKGLHQLLIMMLAHKSDWLCVDEELDKTRKRGKK